LLYIVDIDQTIARRNTPVYLERCNRFLKLGIESSRLKGMTYKDFLRQPEMGEQRERVSQQRLDHVFRLIAFDPAHLRAMDQVPGARDCLETLALIGDVSYATCRCFPTQEELNQHIQAATFEWLDSNVFPNPEDVLFCDGYADKLTQVARLLEREDDDGILVDDSWRELLEAYDAVDFDVKHILSQRLTLWAFGASEVPQYTAIATQPLPTWKPMETYLKFTPTENEKENEEVNHERTESTTA